jgi:hypothetical protein
MKKLDIVFLILVVSLLVSCSRIKPTPEIMEFRIIGGVFHYNLNVSKPEFKIIDEVCVAKDSMSTRRQVDNNMFYINMSKLSPNLKTLISSTFTYEKYKDKFRSIEINNKYLPEIEGTIKSNKKITLQLPQVMDQYLQLSTNFENSKSIVFADNGWYNCIYIKFDNYKELFILYDTIFDRRNNPIPQELRFPSNYQLAHRKIYQLINKCHQITQKTRNLDSITKKIQQKTLKSLFSKMPPPLLM